MKDSSTNLSRQERDEIIAICNELKELNPEFDYKITKIINHVKSKRYGLIWEKHQENVDKQLEDNVPVFVPFKSIDVAGKDKPYNFLLEGDNLHSLKLLQKTHKGRIDVIYIDPPYNTLNEDFAYGDKYLDTEDGFRHSKWLSFMFERLQLAKTLLSPKGLIFISIDENEFAQLKMLCDDSRLFGEQNFVENFIWIKNSTKNNSKTTSTNHEYVMCYAKDISKVKEDEKLFRVKKEGYDEVIEFVEKCKNSKRTYKETETLLREFIKQHQNWKGISSYKYVDEYFKVFASDDASSPNGNGAKYDIIHPVTKKVCKVSSRGWGFTYESMMDLLSRNKILFGKDETTVPRLKRYLEDVETEVLKSIIEDNTDGKKELMKIFDTTKPDFNNPKPTTLIETLLKSVTKEDSIILDFFAGSGTTGEVVVKMNNLDEGNRVFILCTNNEITAYKTLQYLHKKGYMLDYNPKQETSSVTIWNKINKFFEDKKELYDELFVINKEEYNTYGICQSVTYSRLDKVINGYSYQNKNNNITIDGIGANLKYFKTDMVEREPLDSLKDRLCSYVERLIELEHHIDIDNECVRVVWDTYDLEGLMSTDISKLRTLYINSEIETNNEHERFVEKLKNMGIELKDIPNYYFGEEIR